MIGLLTLAAIPTTVAVSEAIAERENNKHRSAADPLKEARQLRKFAIQCYCAGSSPGKKNVHDGRVVVGDGKVYIKSPQSPSPLPKTLMEAESFYVEYPDPARTPSVLGLVTKVSRDPPLLNWIYIDEDTCQLRHANRSGSIRHWIGDFGATDNFEGDRSGLEPDDENEGGGGEESEPSGITFDEEECFVAVQPNKGSQEERDGLWEVWWDINDDKLNRGRRVNGRRVLRISLEREFVEDEGA